MDHQETCHDQAKTVRALAEAEVLQEKIRALVAKEKQKILAKDSWDEEGRKRRSNFWLRLFPWRVRFERRDRPKASDVIANRTERDLRRLGWKIEADGYEKYPCRRLILTQTGVYND